MNSVSSFVLIILSLLVLAPGCGKMSDAHNGIAPSILSAPAPTDNPTTLEKVHLGQKLFFDPRLSRDGTVSCSSCHNVMSSGGDNRSVSVGIGGKTGNRSAPTVWNAAFNPVQFWDGRAATLEDQAKGPLINAIEMGMENHEAVVKRVLAIPGYVEEFKTVFGDSSPISIDTIAKAIAAYERTLVTPNSPFDRYVHGETSALSTQAERGFQLVNQVGCTSCHSGPHFMGSSDRPNFAQFPVNANSEYVAKYRLAEDKGRGALTMNKVDDHYWKIPTWRNVALTAPYFHNGSVPTLDEAVRVMAKVQLNTSLTEAQVQDVVAFLNSLSGEFPKQELPRLPDTPGITLVTP